MSGPTQAAPAARSAAPAQNQEKALSPQAKQEYAIRTMVRRGEARIEQSLPRSLVTMGMTAKMIINAVLNEVIQSDLLLKCDPISVLRSAVDCARLGLIPNRVTGHVYLVPFKENWKEGNEWRSRDICTVIVGYKGLIDLARRSGNISTIQVEAVHDKDEFRYVLGDDARIDHVPYQGNDDPGHLRAVYCIVRLRDGGVQRCVMTTREVDKIRATSKSARSDKSPWNTHPEEMAKKSTIRRISKLLPISIESLNLIERDRVRDEGTDEERRAAGMDPETGIDLGEEFPADVTVSDAHTDGSAAKPEDEADRAAAVKELVGLCQEHQEAAGDLFGGLPPYQEQSVEEIRASSKTLREHVAAATAKPAGKGGRA